MEYYIFNDSDDQYYMYSKNLLPLEDESGALETPKVLIWRVSVIIF